MSSFEYNANPGRVIFGHGTIKKLPEELNRLNLSAPLLLSTPHQVNQAEDIRAILQGKIVGLFTEATMHTPTNVTEKALQYCREQNADCVDHCACGNWHCMIVSSNARFNKRKSVETT